MRVSVVGLGKLGAPMAAVLAAAGHAVTGVDSNPASVEALNQGRAPVEEPGLAELIGANRSRLRATANHGEAVAASEVTFLIVPTPSTADGGFSLAGVLAALDAMGAALAQKDTWHLVVVTSTVLPGSMDGVVRGALERATGKRCGEDFGLCYNPEFIALGSVIRDMLNPDMVLIGESDERSGSMLEDLYRGLCHSSPRIQRMNFVNAELAKLAVNTYVTTKISYANMLAEICERMPGADAGVVAGAVGADSRIGHKYLKGALGYGGPCFPRDNAAFSALARRHGLEATLAEATDRLNRRQAPRVAQLVLDCLPELGVTGMLGLAYKPGTPVVEESQGVAIAQELLRRGVQVVVYDPLAMKNARAELGDRAGYAGSAGECVRQADVIVIATPWPEFRELAREDFKRVGERPVIIDCWGMLDGAKFEPECAYVALGRGPAEPGGVRSSALDVRVRA